MSNKEIQMTSELRVAVQTIKTASCKVRHGLSKGLIRNSWPCIMVWEDIFPRIHATKNGDLVQLKLFVSVCVRNYPG